MLDRHIRFERPLSHQNKGIVDNTDDHHKAQRMQKKKVDTTKVSIAGTGCRINE